jgi:hypothetical protein
MESGAYAIHWSAQRAYCGEDEGLKQRTTQIVDGNPVANGSEDTEVSAGACSNALLATPMEGAAPSQRETLTPSEVEQLREHSKDVGASAQKAFRPLFRGSRRFRP